MLMRIAREEIKTMVLVVSLGIPGWVTATTARII